MHFQLYFIVKLLCKLEEKLKQNNQKPPHWKTPLWWAKSKGTIYPSNIPVSLRNLLSQEKTGATEKQTGSCTQSTSIVLHIMMTWGVPSIIKFLPQVDIQRNLSPDFVMTKVPRRDCYKSVSSSIVIRKGKV